jgi:xanthine dehydrogenase YagR molybdenum-binding subunit
MASESATSQVIGKPIDRTDGRQKVTGQALYAADFPARNIAYAVAFQSTIASGRVKSIDSAEARRQPGVLAVITHENAPALHRVSMDHTLGKPGQTFLPLQGDEIHYAGQYLGMVVAETITQALHAAALVKVDYEPQTPVVHMEEALDRSFTPKKMGRGAKTTSNRGEPDNALAGAAVKIDQTYTTPIENHNPMELSATIASWEGNRLTLHDATQWVFGVRSVVSTWLGIPGDQVRVIDPFVGGGFGCKGSMWPHIVLSAIAARQVNRPVKLVLTRSQMFTCVGYRPRTIQRVALGADAQGKLISVIHECTSQTSSWKDEWVEAATEQSRMLYSCPNVRTNQKLAPVNANTPTQMRAPGHATGTFALEVAMDELAYAAGIDPLELRLRNYAERDENEQKPFSSKALRDCYRQASERFGWRSRNPQPGSMRDGNWLVGWGMATATYPTNQMEASAKVRILADGRVVVSTAAHDLGTGAYTILAQIAADTLDVPIENVKVELADTVLPEAPGAGGSQTTASVGSAVNAACQKALSALKERASADPASPLSGKEAKTITVNDGRIFLKDSPSSGESIADLLRRNGGRPIEGKSDVSPPAKPNAEDEDAGAAQNVEQFSKHAWGAQFAEVRIDPQLGHIRVARWVGAFAGGRILNAKTAHSQIMGGIVWGISMALLEHTVYDPNRAKVVNDNLADYMVPVNADIPPIDCFFVEERDEHVNPIGVKGIGELGITGAAAAIANAVYHATGKRLRDLPITLDRLI